MRKETRQMYNAYLASVARNYGVENTTEKFAVETPIETSLNKAIQESTEFLNMITVAPVTDMKGQALEIGVNGLVAKRTNVSTSNRRQPKTADSPDGTSWEAAMTEFDFGISYDLLDIWARYKNFPHLYMESLFKAIALDRLTVGWYGQSAEADTDPATNTLGQDVNVGWLQTLQDQYSTNYMTEGAVAGEISIGSDAAADYANLDHLVNDLLAGIPTEHRTGNEIAIIGTGLITNDVSTIAQKYGQQPSEKNVGIVQLAKQYGGLPAMEVSRFPDKGVLVTDPKNLHLYYQEGRMRRHTKDEPEYNRVVDYISSNDAYAIGNKKAITAINADNVVFKDA